MIKIQIYPVTMLGTNCCYLVDEATGKCAVSDPGERSRQLERQIDNKGGKLDYVLLTITFATQSSLRTNTVLRSSRASTTKHSSKTAT